jgi:hypothetical protein
MAEICGRLTSLLFTTEAWRKPLFFIVSLDVPQ